MRSTVKHVVQHCGSCQRVKASALKPAGLLHPLPIPTKQWSEVAMDFIVELPATATGKNAIYVFTDKLTKMVHFAATTTKCTATEAAHLFMEKVWLHHGLPVRMVHDRDTRFTSAFWTECFKLLNVKQANSSAYHPQTDGQTERVNRVLEDYLRHYVNEYQSNWDELLMYAEFAYNNAYHESIGCSPFRLNYGFDPLTPVSFLSEPHKLAKSKVHQAVLPKCPESNRFVESMQHAVAVARKNLEAVQQRQKQYADAHRRDVSYHIGDEVLLSTKNLKLKEGSRKLLPKFIGPFRITEIINPVAVRLDLPATLRTHSVFHVSLLRQFHEGAAFMKAPPLPSIIDGELEYTVESLLAHECTKKGLWFLVKWTGYPATESTWEPESNLTNCREVLMRYKKANKLLK